MPNPNGNPDNLRPPWKPGESGNPGGRPQTKPLTDTLRRILEMPADEKFKPATKLEKAAWKWYRAILEDAKSRAQALDRLEGKVAQPVESAVRIVEADEDIDPGRSEAEEAPPGPGESPV